MSHDVDSDGQDRPDGGSSEVSESPGVETIEAYDTDDGIVLYDAQNPLAWLKTTAPITLHEHV